MKTVRAFIAIELSTEMKAVLGDVVTLLQQMAATRAVKWVTPERMHLTLRFLGDTPVERLDAVRAVMDEAGARQKPFELALDRLGCFPNERQPRVIWVGVSGEADRAVALHGALSETLAQAGWEQEGRPFQPHLTLGRVKERGARIELPWGKRVAGAKSQVGEMTLFESQLRPEGPLYIVRHSSKLGGSA